MITSEDLFQSIDTIVKKRLESVNYDTTVICRIIDNKQKNIGKYQVTNESITFEAYSDYSDYKIGDRVRVTIPNNDYNNKKWIEGKCDINEEDKIKIEDDINILSLSGNLVNIESTTNIQLNANDILNKQEIELNIPHNLFDLLANSQLYNAVKLSANFKVAPENILYDIETGCYGLELQLINKNGDIQSYILSSQDMVGDPYYFIISTSQQKDFILDNILLNEINQIKLYAFQDQQFKYMHNNNLQDVPIDYLPISISNIELSFGTTIHDKINKSVNIFSISEKDYNVGVTNSLKKTIGLFWNNLEGNNYIGFSDGINDKDYDENEYQSLIETSPDQKDNYDQRYCIYWYRYNPQAIENTDKFLTGKGWERIPDTLNIGLPIYETAEDAEYYTAQIDYHNDNNYLVTELNKGRLVERYQAVLIYEHIIYKSNILEFTNTEIDSDYELTESITGFDLEHGMNSRDTYLFYDETRKIKNKSDSLLNRCIQVKYKSLDNKDLLFVDGTIKWQIPKTFTMLEVGNIDNNMWVKEETADYYEYIGTIPTIEENETISIDYSKLIFQYKIKQEYSNNFNNNTITCVISKGNAAIELEQNLIFGQQGTNGTDYTIVINSKERVAVKRGEEGALPINIAFTNPEGENLEVIPNVHFIPSSYGSNILPFSYDSNSQTIVWSDTDETRLQNGIYGLIQVSCSYNNQILTIIEPIAFAANDNPEYYLEGNTTIIYDYNGTHPKYNRDTPYKLFDISNNQEITDLTWKLIFLDYEGKPIAAENYVSPILTLTDSNCLKAAQMYSNEIQTTEIQARKYPVIQAINTEGKVIYSQSIYIDKNIYASTLLNNWDGQVQLKDSLYIAAPILMAGEKNINNTFTGIVMGDLKDATQYLSTGLYGFNLGELTYGFKTDGTAFIGASGQGRIEFDGTKGIIQSANYTSTTGMQIDLQSGLINAYNFKLNSANIQLNSNPAIGENYFYVGDNTRGYLQFIKTDIGNDFVLKLNSWLVEVGAANTNNYFYLGSDIAKDDIYKLIIGENFKVSSAGDIVAKSGVIGNIIISNLGLSSAQLDTYESVTTFKANLIYNKDSAMPEMTVTDYNENSTTAWNNIVYNFNADVTSVYIYKWGSKTEFFIRDGKYSPVVEGENYELAKHFYSYELKDSYKEIEQPTSNMPWHIIINTNPSIQIIPIVLKEPPNNNAASFIIHNNGVIEATSVNLEGNITAASLTASANSEIAGWNFANGNFYGYGTITAAAPTGYRTEIGAGYGKFGLGGSSGYITIGSEGSRGSYLQVHGIDGYIQLKYYQKSDNSMIPVIEYHKDNEIMIYDITQLPKIS